MNKILAGTLVAVGLAGAISLPIPSVGRINALHEQLEDAGIYRAEELTTLRDELGSALESCLSADGTEMQSPDCGALRERYAAVGEELVQLVNTPEYQPILRRREEIDDKIAGLKTFTPLYTVLFGTLGVFGFLGYMVASLSLDRTYNPPKKK